MGIEVIVEGKRVEFNSLLALRKSNNESVPQSERLPHGRLTEGFRGSFEKSGRRIYPLGTTIPLCETDGEKISDPVAYVSIESYEHTTKDDKVITTGQYKVLTDSKL